MRLVRTLRRTLMAGFGAALALGLALGAAPAAGSHSFKILHSFCETDCSDGKSPTGTMLMDSSNNLFGTTMKGGEHGGGAAFELVYQPSTGKYHYKRLYNFCAIANCDDGTNPVDEKLVMDTAGNLYGTTEAGGQGLSGVIYRLEPNQAKTRYTYHKIYDFCVRSSGCEDGASPTSGLTYSGAVSGTLYDGVSSLYGSTLGGGKKHDGVVYSFTPAHGDWIQKVLYFFCTTKSGDLDCVDGKLPMGGMVVDKNGNLLGTASQGGHGQVGVVFKLTPTVRGRWVETTPYEFCAVAGCTDGATPQTGVIMDVAGNIFGTTLAGGAVGTGCEAGCGVMFKLTPNGNETQVYTFCSQTDCSDGAAPAGLVMDVSGNIFGATHLGGLDGNGVLYELTAGAETYTALYNVKCGHTGCDKGNNPTGSLVLNSSNVLFGMYSDGGRFGTGGVLFQFTPVQ